MTDKAIEAAVDEAIEQGLAVSRLRLHAIMRAAIAAYERAMWQPIESAKKDGTRFIVYTPERCEWCKNGPGIYVVKWNTRDGGFWNMGRTAETIIKMKHNPTHYRPLPPPPGDGG